VLNINPRAERHGDDERAIAVDVSFRVTVPAVLLNTFCAELDIAPEWERYLFDETSGEPLALGLGKIAFASKYDEHDVSIERERDGEMSGLSFTDAKVGRFKAEPASGRRVSLDFQVQVEPGGDGEAGWLAGLVSADSVRVAVNGGAQADLVEDGGGEPAEDEGAAAEPEAETA